MPTFSYRAKDAKGEIIQGNMEAEAVAAVASRLQAMGYFPLSIRDEVKKKPITAASLVQNLGRRRRVRAADIATFDRQMADLIGAGVTLVKALNIIATQTTSDTMKEIVAQVSGDVQSGETLALSLSKHPRAFSKLYVAMVRAGEAGGMLESVLSRLADFAESEEELKGRVKSMLIYPAIMIVVGIVAVSILMVVVMPKITGIYKDLHQALPAVTILLVSISTFMGGYWWALAVAAASAAAGFWRWVKTKEGKTLFDTWILKAPVIGSVVQKREVARFARTLGALLHNGVSILPALEITIDVMTNNVVRREVAQIPPNISQGSGMSAPLRNSKVFPPVVVNMIAIGEETGRLAEVLQRVAQSYETEVDRSVRSMVALIEPLIILTLGVVVGFIVVAMLLPIFSLDPSAQVS